MGYVRRDKVTQMTAQALDLLRLAERLVRKEMQEEPGHPDVRMMRDMLNEAGVPLGRFCKRYYVGRYRRDGSVSIKDALSNVPGRASGLGNKSTKSE